jgi:hypothetical protein
MHEADFALQWLDFLGNKIYNNGRQIFKYNGEPNYDISRLKSVIRVGQDFGNEKKTMEYSNLPYSEVQKIGYVVVTGTDFIWRSGQKCYFKLKKKARDVVGISEGLFNRRLQVQHDAQKRRIRLVGEDVYPGKNHRANDGIGSWIIYDEDKPVQHDLFQKNILTKEHMRASLRKWAHGVQPQEDEFVNIKELPVLITEENYIACIQKEQTCQRMIVVGESGAGKSVFTNAISGRILYIWQDRVGWLIDPLNQFNDISVPQPHKKFQKLNDIIKNEPKPIPAVQLLMACRNKITIRHEDISLVYVVNFVEFLRKYKFFTYGIKEMDVGDTIRYLMDFMNEIKDATTARDIRDTMMEKIPNAHKDKGIQAMIYKWVNTFETIFKEKFTSNLYDGIEKVCSELEVEFKDGRRIKGHPFIMLYEAGLMPVFNIAEARRARWIRNVLADLMQKIVKHQSQIDERLRHRVWIIADELNEIYEKGKKKDNAFESFEELYRQGRVNAIGFVGNTQSLDKLNPEMYKNATHVCCAYMKDPKERKRVGDTYDLPKAVYNKIESLKEREMMIFSKQPFVLYDRWGRRKVSDRKWIRGKILPPINLHKVPAG